MEVKACRKCKRLFNYIGGQQMCPACREELEKKFQEVKKYLQDHRGASLIQTAKDCEVEETQIRQWVREERLEFASGIDAGVVCEICGTPISSGKYCEKCKFEMINGLTAAGRRPEKPVEQQKALRSHENKMRFIGSDRI